MANFNKLVIGTIVVLIGCIFMKEYIEEADYFCCSNGCFCSGILKGVTIRFK